MKRAAILLLVTTLGAVTVAGIPVPASAKDLGVRGATWPVAEPDLLAQIESRLLEMETLGRAGTAGARRLAPTPAESWKNRTRRPASRRRASGAAGFGIRPSRSRGTSARPTAR